MFFYIFVGFGTFSCSACTLKWLPKQTCILYIDNWFCVPRRQAHLTEITAIDWPSSWRTTRIQHCLFDNVCTVGHIQPIGVAPNKISSAASWFLHISLWQSFWLQVYPRWPRSADKVWPTCIAHAFRQANVATHGKTCKITSGLPDGSPVVALSTRVACTTCFAAR